MDVLSASWNDDTIAWYENDGSESFTPHVITDSADRAWSVFAADMDGDGDMDVLSASLGDDTIAWYENENFDFGDAPLPYPTTLSEDGARHGPIGPTLGTNRDLEVDGTHSAAADADDTTGAPDDEDGVTFDTIRAGQLDATVTVNVQNAPNGAKLDAWIDFNGDGSWGGPFEQIADSVSVVNGDNVISFDVPSWAKAGSTYARFRLSTAGGLGIGGKAEDGEVEDHQIAIASPVAANDFSENRNTVTTSAKYAGSMFAADVDGDGDMDVLSVSGRYNTISWYENDGSESFAPHHTTSYAGGPSSVFAVDMDGDGDVDVLSATAIDDTIAWYENDGNAGFTPHVITNSADNAYSVFAADVDGDGDMDVLSASEYDDTIAWYENDGSEGFTSHDITTSADGAVSVFAADVDGDGDMDVLSASGHDDTIAWYENDGSEGFTRHKITVSADCACSVFAADVDGDGDMDVLSASELDDTIAWYENDGSESFTPHVITASADYAYSVIAADVDGDGDIDVLSSPLWSGTIAWYENDGSEGFTPHVITASAEHANSVFAADMDGDGDIDVLTASGFDGTIAWYENDVHDSPSTIGLYNSKNPEAGEFFLRDSNTAGVADTTFGYGPGDSNWIPIAGDWNGDGGSTVGLYNASLSEFYLKNTHSGGTADVMYAYGPAGSNWVPVAGDWNGDGTDTLGLYNQVTSTFYLKNSHGGGVADIVFDYGPAGSNWVPVAGDWDGDGTDTLGLYNPETSQFCLKNSHSGGVADIVFDYGPAGSNWVPVVGDWDGDGDDTLGLYDSFMSQFYLKNSHSGGVADIVFGYGPAGAGWTPLTGNWTASSAIQLDAVPLASPVSDVNLTESDLSPIVETAIGLWADTGVSASNLSMLENVQITISDLSGSTLALTTAGSIVVDVNAAGCGWYMEGPNSEVAESQADLLTVVAHELGHVLGLGHDVSDDVMDPLLPLGTRRLPGFDIDASQLDDLFADADDLTAVLSI